MGIAASGRLLCSKKEGTCSSSGVDYRISTMISQLAFSASSSWKHERTVDSSEGFCCGLQVGALLYYGESFALFGLSQLEHREGLRSSLRVPLQITLNDACFMRGTK